MAFDGKIPEQESLQCLACAGLQKIGDNFNIDDLRQLMKQGKGSGEAHPDNNDIWDHVKLDSTTQGNIFHWGNSPSRERFLVKWLNSSLWVAKSLKAEQIYKGDDYIFYRVDQFPGRGKYKTFKSVFEQIQKNIKDAAKDKDAKQWFEGSSAKIFRDIEMAGDKWNPADFVAVRSGKVTEWITKIQNFVTDQNQRGSARGVLTQDLQNFALQQKNASKRGEAKINILLGMSDLYEYNKEITDGMQSGDFLPISLKLTQVENPGVKTIKVAEPSDLQKYFHLQVIPGDFEYKATTGEAKMYFRVQGLPGSDGEYSFTIRAQLSTEVFKGDVTNELKDLAVKSAQAGKIAISKSTRIAQLSGGRRSFSTLNRKRKELWKKYTPAGMKNPTKGVFWKYTASKNHKFTSYEVFDKLHKVHADNMRKARKDKQADLKRAQLGFDSMLDEKGRVRPADKTKTIAEDPSGIVNDIQMWAEYAEWLSNGATTQQQFMEQALGRNQWRMVMASEIKERLTSKKPERRNASWKYDITLSMVQAKYMKAKIQSYEQAWILDPGAKDNPLSQEVRKNILKSMWMYAASKGFVIFRKNTVSAYLLSGSHIKCAA